MSPLFKKLNLGAQSVIHVLNAPESFEPELAALKGVTIKPSVSGRCGFAMAFVISQAELDVASTQLAKACEGDAVLWMVYPKGTSKKYKCEFNRDSGWSTLGSAGFEPVRMVAVDADWSALRFRRVEHIKTMARNLAGAISEAGKREASSSDASHQRSRARSYTQLPPNGKSKGELIMPTGTIRLHRVLRAKPERVYRAFLDADAMAKWLPPYGFTCKVHHMDAKVGGTYKMSFTNFTTGHGHSFGGEYRELVPFEKIRYTARFDDQNLPGEMQTTVTLKQVSCGTEINVVQEGLPEAIPLEMCYLGWQESLAQLANLVEPEIPE